MRVVLCLQEESLQPLHLEAASLEMRGSDSETFRSLRLMRVPGNGAQNCDDRCCSGFTAVLAPRFQRHFVHVDVSQP